MDFEFYECKVDCVVDGFAGKITSIKWTCEIEVREWGIKSLVLSIPPQTIHVIRETDSFDTELEEEIFIEDVRITGDTERVPLHLAEIEIEKGKVVAYF